MAYLFHLLWAGVVFCQHLQADEIADAHVDEGPEHRVHSFGQGAAFGQRRHISLGVLVVILQEKIPVNVQGLED